MIDLKQIKARCEAATEGPWWKIVLPWRDCTTEPYVFAGPTEEPHGGIPVADSPLHEAIESDIDNEANMTFIAHARQDLPDCTAEIERLRGLLKVAKCPCCDGSGGYYDNHGNACQCQWCDEVKQALEDE